MLFWGNTKGKGHKCTNMGLTALREASAFAAFAAFAAEGSVCCVSDMVHYKTGYKLSSFALRRMGEQFATRTWRLSRECEWNR